MPVASENEFLLHEDDESETHSMEAKFIYFSSAFLLFSPPLSLMLVLHFYSFDVEHEN
jgi:hypothetical protein